MALIVILSYITKQVSIYFGIALLITGLLGWFLNGIAVLSLLELVNMNLDILSKTVCSSHTVAEEETV